MIKCSKCLRICDHVRDYWCIDCRRTYNREYRKRKKDRLNHLQRTRRDDPYVRNRVRAQGCHRKAIRRGAVPCTCCSYEQIIEFYMNRKKGMTVDHIIPCCKGGMHCLKNLQYLSVSENCKKHTKAA